MGSFNVTCAVSHLSIAPGDPAVLIPLKLDKHAFKEFGFQFNQAFQMLPGIVGIYDDYGRLRDITPPAFYQYIPTGQLWLDQATGKGECNDIEGYTYTWVHGAVYAAMIKGLRSSVIDTTSVLESATAGAEILLRLGFVLDGETGMERFGLKFVTAGVKDRYVACDGIFSQMWINGVKSEKLTYSAQDVIDEWPEPLNIEAFDGMRYMDWGVEQKIAEYRKATADIEGLINLSRYEMGDDDRTLLKENTRLSGYFALDSLERGLDMQGLLAPVLDNLDELKKDLADLMQFKTACNLCGILITPTLAGPQCGDQIASFALADLILNVADDNLRKHAEEEEEDFEDED